MMRKGEENDCIIAHCKPLASGKSETEEEKKFSFDESLEC